MAPPRTFDYDVLNRVIRDHPEWSNQQLADVMTQYERKARKDPGYPPVKANAIARAKSSMRPTWEHEGRGIPDREYGRLLPWPGIPQEFIMDTRLRHVKALERLRLGQPVPPRQARQATAYRDALLQNGLILDITDEGEPYERAARPGEAGRITAEPRLDWLERVSGVNQAEQDKYTTRLETRHAGRPAPIHFKSALDRKDGYTKFKRVQTGQVNLGPALRGWPFLLLILNCLI